MKKTLTGWANKNWKDFMYKNSFAPFVFPAVMEDKGEFAQPVKVCITIEEIEPKKGAVSEKDVHKIYSKRLERPFM